MTLPEFLSEWNDTSERLLVHTSGSTGTPKPMWVEKHRMEASARITCDFLNLHPGDTALLCMPLDYIAGKMMVVRSLVRDLKLTVVEPSGHPFASLLPQHDASMPPFDLVAMVPLQVYNTLQVPAECEVLRRARHLIIGGGAIDDQIASRLKDFPNAVWSTYGMTETLSHIALRRLNGPDASEWYTPFPSVRVGLSAEGCLVIDAPLVCAEPLTTNDLCELNDDGKFRILGRRDNIICSGGLKIQMEEVERLLKPHFTVPFVITKRSDPKFGEAVALITEGNTAEAEKICRMHLPRHWMPRHYLHVEHLPLTATGKIARKEAERLMANE